jgi:hypothetical protein
MTASWQLDAVVDDSRVSGVCNAHGRQAGHEACARGALANTDKELRRRLSERDIQPAEHGNAVD